MKTRTGESLYTSKRGTNKASNFTEVYQAGSKIKIAVNASLYNYFSSDTLATFGNQWHMR